MTKAPDRQGPWLISITLGLMAACVVTTQGIRRSAAEGHRLASEVTALQPTGVQAAVSKEIDLNRPTEFYLPGCSACEQVAPFLDDTEDDQLRFDRIDVSTPEGHVRLRAFLRGTRVSTKRTTPLPIVFLGHLWLAGPEEITVHLKEDAEQWKRGIGRVATGSTSEPSLRNSILVFQAHRPAVPTVDEEQPQLEESHATMSLPLFRLSTPDGRTVTNADLSGRPVLLAFLCGCDRCMRFATAWMREPIPASASVWTVSGFEHIGISLRSGARTTFPMLYDPNQALSKSLNATECPQVRLIDATGQVVWSAGGRTTKPEALAHIAAGRLQKIVRVPATTVQPDDTAEAARDLLR